MHICYGFQSNNMANFGSKSDQEILDLLRQGREEAVDALFRQHYGAVVGRIFQYLGDPVYAEDIAQELFTELWVKREKLSIQSSLRSYLLKAASNRAINHMKAHKHLWLDLDDQEEVDKLGAETPGSDSCDEDLQKILDEAIRALPDKCRMVFCMSRFDEKTYADIAAELNISIKTVENHMTKAFRLLREAVKEKNYIA